jgi:hypothetical protein
MKKKLFTIISRSLVIAFVIAGLMLPSCQKEIQADSPVNPEAELQSRGSHTGNKKECRLVFATNTDPAYSEDFNFHYNSKGLMDEWAIKDYGLFKQEYDARGKVKKSVHSIDGQVIFTVHFFYKGDKVVKNIYYYGTGTDIMDEMYYTYNAQGRMVRAESFVNDHVSITKYNPEGNMSSNELFFGGLPVFSQYFKYSKQYKNPFLAIPGIEYNFPYYSPAWPFYSKWRYASVKEVAYDENSDPIVTFEFDPSKTQWRKGPQNYTGSATYFDILGASWFPYRFEFENCGGGRGNDYNHSHRAAPAIGPGARKIDPMMLLKRNPAKTMKEQVKELRQQLKSFKNSGVPN